MSVNRWTMVRFLALLAFVAALPAAAAELVMVEQRGCSYCKAWDAEIGVAYDKTAEGAAAPLRRVDLHKAMPEDLHFARRVTFTPTFVLVDAEGQELGRIEGYPGDHFFWPMLGRLLSDAGLNPAAPPATN